MTNRKIVVDQYDGYAPVGGGLSGKDMSKVDRCATYRCCYLAKNIVAAGIADTAKVELVYMIGVPQPCAINVELNRNQVLSEAVKTWIKDNIDLTPMGIMVRFDGSNPRYNVVTKFGHFGITNRELTLFKENNYFPTQKRLKIVPRIWSVVISPVIDDRWCIVSRMSCATKSPEMPERKPSMARSIDCAARVRAS